LRTKTEKHYLESRVQCINWQCSGSIYIVEGKDWKAPNFVCDDCGAVWTNSLAEKSV